MLLFYFQVKLSHFDTIAIFGVSEMVGNFKKWYLLACILFL